MRYRRPMEAAVRLLRAATAPDAGEPGVMSGQVQRVMQEMTSRGEREVLVANLALLGSSMARRVPAEEREAVFAQLEQLARLSPADTELLRELAAHGMVA